MATVHCVLGSCAIGGRAGITRIPETAAEAAETITSSGASQATTAAAPAGDEGVRFWSVTAVGGNVWIKFGAAPVAASGQDWLVLDGQTREFAARGGDKVAVIDA